MASSHATQAYRPDIDGLRAVSVALVVVFHIDRGLIPGGYIGVDVFFVISGYLITNIIGGSLASGRFSILEFYERRARRILPALLTVLAVTAAFAYILQMPSALRSFGRSLAWTPLFASNFIFAKASGYFDPSSLTQPLLHTWSLAIEEQFYVFYPWILVLLLPRRPNRIVILSGIVAASLLASVVSGALQIEAAYYLLPTRFWELGIGGLLALSRLHLPAVWRNVLGPLGLTLIVASALLLNEAVAFPGWLALLPTAGACAVIAGSGSFANAALGSRVPMVLGKLSYPAYLWHWPVIVFFQLVTLREPNWVDGLGIILVTVVLSWLTVVGIENPIRQRRWLATRRQVFGAMATASMCLVAVGIVFFVSRGAPWRFSASDLATLGVQRTPPLIETLCDTNRDDPNPDGCDIGATVGPIAFAVLGDSHAGVLAGALHVVAQRNGLKGRHFASNGCPPLDGVDRPRLGRRCAERLAHALKVIEDLNTPVVVLAARWAYHMTPSRSDLADHFRVIVDGHVVPDDAMLATTTAALRRTLDILAGRKILIMSPVPEPGFDVPDALVRARRLGLPEARGLPKLVYEHRTRDVMLVLNGLARSNSNVSLIDTSKTLCDADWCSVARNGRPLYSDNNHLSASGVGLFEAELAAQLRRLSVAE